MIQSTIRRHNGEVFGTAGDSFRGVFGTPSDALAAAVDCQQGLENMDWGRGPALRVRMGIHHGPATEQDGDFLGPVPNTSARVEALGHGGQVLLTSEVEQKLPDVKRTDHLLWLGEYRLRDVPEPVSIFQIGQQRFPALRHVDPALSSLPSLGTKLIGREEEVPHVRGLLRDNCVVTLTGYGGCGKTKLALEVAHQELPSRPGGCYFVDLAAVVDEDEFPATVASSIRLTLTGADPTRQILDYLAERDALLVLDNCEHLVEVCADFAERVTDQCETKLLITSRQRLDIASEKVLLVSPLLCDSPDSAAVRLFLERAGLTEGDTDGGLEKAGQSPSKGDLASIQEICCRLDGIPLAIELAAARASVLSPAELLERMEDRFRLLSGGRRRQKRRTLLATLDWSYGLLEPEERRLFRHCGVFSGSFDLEAAQSVSLTDEYQTIDLLQSLVVKSLVSSRTIDGGTRFHLLETVRAYALDRLDDSGELQDARDRHLAHFATLACTNSWAVSCDIVRSRRLRIDWSNLSAGLEWAISNLNWDLAADMAFGCQGLWEHQVPATEGKRWIQQILDGLEEPLKRGGPVQDRTRLGDGGLAAAITDSGERIDQLGINLALLAMQLDDFDTMYRYLVSLDETASPVTAAQALGFRAFTRIRHNSEEAMALIERADSLVRSCQLGPEAATPSLWSRGTHALYDARFQDALPLLEEAYRSARSEETFTTHGVIAGLACASNLVLLGRPQEAIQVLDEGTWESVWDASKIVRALALLDMGQAVDAAKLIIDFGNQALLGRLSRMSNDALVGFAALAISRQEPDRGWGLLTQAITPRTPASIALAEGLADRIGHGAELRDLHRNRLVPVSTLDASASLRHELARLSGEASLPS